MITTAILPLNADFLPLIKEVWIFMHICQCNHDGNGLSLHLLMHSPNSHFVDVP